MDKLNDPNSSDPQVQRAIAAMEPVFDWIKSAAVNRQEGE